ncbi:DMT family transporter [Allofournierella sp.]|uniref:DMT family transporter n=1 Tax=Allofournierella sp. TaxID=1940256 RepID=UPI003AB4D246
MQRELRAGHLAAGLTMLIWGTTFISTKVLLRQLSPVEILFLRFLLGYLALWLICPRRLRGVSGRQNAAFALAGLTGICLYYLLENVALTFTFASNVGVIISVAPFFTALLAHWMFRGAEPLRPRFFAGFAAAMAGVCLLSFSGGPLKASPAGDLLALAAALVWACYSLLTRVIGGYGFGAVQVTRRVFFFGLLFMLPTLPFSPFDLRPALLAEPQILLNLLFLGLGASALCFVTWNFAVRALGPVRTSAYIYAVPVVTLAASALLLHEAITPAALAGTALTLTGLFLSESGDKAPKKGAIPHGTD